MKYSKCLRFFGNDKTTTKQNVADKYPEAEMGVEQEFPEQLNHHHPALCEGGAEEAMTIEWEKIAPVPRGSRGVSERAREGGGLGPLS